MTFWMACKASQEAPIMGYDRSLKSLDLSKNLDRSYDRTP